MTQLKQLAKRFFQYEAKLVLKKYKPKIIVITGSVGKTLTKDFLYPILSKKFFVRKSEKSFTSKLGVPLTIIGCPEGSGSIIDWARNLLIGLKLLLYKTHYPSWLILEVDGDKPGDLSSLSTWLHPDILVITEIGKVPSHIETFDSDLGKFLNEKKSLVDSVSRTGVIIYNIDDDIVSNLVHDTPVRTVSCGTYPGSNVRGSDLSILYNKSKAGMVPTGMSYDILLGEQSGSVTILSTLGISIQYATLLAVAVGNELGISLSECAPILSKVNVPAGRMNIINGIKDSVILDDSYNSSPVAMEQALDVLSKIETTTRKIAVIGDMLELGRFSADEHRKLAGILKKISSYVICVGIRSRRISEELLSMEFPEELISSFDTSDEAGKFLQNILQDGDIILVKGSQAMRMEKVVEEVMRHPEDKAKLLVRQDTGWIERE